jgi:hypothetical protein
VETAEKIKDLEMDIEDTEEKTARTLEKIANVARTIANIRYVSGTHLVFPEQSTLEKTANVARTIANIRYVWYVCGAHLVFPEQSTLEKTANVARTIANIRYGMLVEHTLFFRNSRNGKDCQCGQDYCQHQVWYVCGTHLVLNLKKSAPSGKYQVPVRYCVTLTFRTPFSTKAKSIFQYRYLLLFNKDKLRKI